MRTTVGRGFAALAAVALLLAGLGHSSDDGPVSTTVVETSTASGYVSSADPSTVYAMSTKLYVGAGRATFKTYLRFDLTDREGVLTDASLQLHTAGADSGSVASQTVWTTSNGWSESTLSYRTARAPETLVGVRTAATRADATYSVPLSTDVLQAAVGGTLSLMITQTAPDDLVLSSRDTPTPPRLSLTFDGKVTTASREHTVAGPRTTEAAVLNGWGRPVAGDEFNYLGAPKESTWAVYDSPGHAGNGRRSPAHAQVDGSVLRISGDADGTTAGMSQRFDQVYGKWEARMRVSPDRDVKYHPVLIVWPDQGRVPDNNCAEIDYAESTRTVDQVNFIVHHTCSGPPARVRHTLDMTQWHNYAVYWSAGAVRGYIDGVQIFETTDPAEIPDDPAHQTIQLDWFPDGSATTPTWMEVDWVRVYR